MDEIDRALDATDAFLQTLHEQNEDTYDANVIPILRRIREEHRIAFSVIDSVRDEFDGISSEEYDSEAGCDCEHFEDDPFPFIGTDFPHSLQSQHFGKRRCRSMHCLRECWQEERMIRFNEEQLFHTKFQPFEMTLRDEFSPIKTTYSKKFVDKMLRKKQEDEQKELQMIKRIRFKAKNVPRTTREPIYQRMVSEQEKARDLRRERAKEAIEESRSPFSENRRSRQTFHSRRCTSAERSVWKRTEGFKASAVPMSIYVSPYKYKYSAALRARLKCARTANWLRISRTPSGLEEHSIRSKVQNDLRHGRLCQSSAEESRRHRSLPVPDFKKLHAKLSLKLELACRGNQSTTAIPFQFHTRERVRPHRCEIEKPKQHLMNRRSVSLGNLSEDSWKIRLNAASLLRNDAIRSQMKKQEEEKHNSTQFWHKIKERNQLNRQHLQQKLAGTTNTDELLQCKINEKRKEQQRIARDYRNKLGEMFNRLKNRALIIEQQEMLIEKQRFERVFNQSMARLDRFAKRVTFNERKTVVQESATQSEGVDGYVYPLSLTPSEKEENSSEISDSEDWSDASETNSVENILSRISERTEES